MSLATEYAAFIREARQRQLVLNREAVSNLERLLAETAGRLRENVLETTRGIQGLRYRREVFAKFDRELERFREAYKEQLDAGILEGARNAERRETQLLDAILRERGLIPAEQQMQATIQVGRVQAGFSSVPRNVLERLYARVHPDGLHLSDRLYALTDGARAELRDLVTTSIAQGQSAKKLADQIAPLINREGADDTAYRAMRIARTEINQAFRDGHVASVTTEGEQLKPWVHAIGWRLSGRHPRVDICCRAGTLVETFAGPVPIEDVQIGDLVLTHVGRWREVTQTFENPYEGEVLEVAPGAWLTPNHPVLANEIWTPAKRLWHGQVLTTARPASRGGYVWGTRFAGFPAREQHNGPVYNLGVSGDNSYFANGIAVHNCDAWAGDDSGLGPGNYLPGDVPTDHPHGLCFTVSILAAYPDRQFVQHAPDPAGVPESQRVYYGKPKPE